MKATAWMVRRAGAVEIHVMGGDFTDEMFRDYLSVHSREDFRFCQIGVGAWVLGSDRPIDQAYFPSAVWHGPKGERELR